MKRIIVLALLAAAVVAIASLGTGASDDKGGTKYTVELDNAFGLTEGADLKIAGVRAGVEGTQPRGAFGVVDRAPVIRVDERQIHQLSALIGVRDAG